MFFKDNNLIYRGDNYFSDAEMRRDSDRGIYFLRIQTKEENKVYLFVASKSNNG